jgi:hypothetical protein
MGERLVGLSSGGCKGEVAPADGLVGELGFSAGGSEMTTSDEESGKGSFISVADIRKHIVELKGMPQPNQFIFKPHPDIDPRVIEEMVRLGFIEMAGGHGE